MSDYDLEKCACYKWVESITYIITCWNISAFYKSLQCLYLTLCDPLKFSTRLSLHLVAGWSGTDASRGWERYSLQCEDTYSKDMAGAMRVLNLAFVTIYYTFILGDAHKNTYRVHWESKKVLSHTVSKGLRIYTHGENHCGVHYVFSTHLLKLAFLPPINSFWHLL